MKNGWIGMVALVLLATAAHGQMLAEGTQELGVDGLVDFSTANGTLIRADLSYGYFIYDYTELIGSLGFQDSDDYTLWSLGFGSQYNFDLASVLVPYCGAGLKLASYETSSMSRGSTVEDDGIAFVFGLEGGIKYFITDNMALSGALVFEIATEDLYSEDDGFENTDARLDLGLRYFFF